MMDNFHFIYKHEQRDNSFRSQKCKKLNFLTTRCLPNSLREMILMNALMYYYFYHDGGHYFFVALQCQIQSLLGVYPTIQW